MSKPILHPTLKRPLVAEAIFEVRFSGGLGYGLLPGRFFESVQTNFPSVEQLPAAQMPIELDAPIARHRFKSADGQRLLQVGVGLFSLNHIGYLGYAAFRQDAQRALKTAENLGLLDDVRRLGLRYVNRTEQTMPASDMVSYAVEVPDFVNGFTKARQVLLVGEVPSIGVIQSTIGWPVQDPTQVGKNFLVLDFDCFLERIGKLRINDVISWLDRAHEHVYQTFRASLNPSYLGSLE